MSKIRGPCTYSGVTEASDSGGIDSETQSEIVNNGVRGMLNSGMSLICTVNVNVNSEQ